MARVTPRTSAADVNIGLVPEATKGYGKLFYTWEHSDFENALPYEFERAGFDGGSELSRTLTLVGDVGKESALDVNTSEGGLDSDFWSAGLRWQAEQPIVGRSPLRRPLFRQQLHGDHFAYGPARRGDGEL